MRRKKHAEHVNLERWLVSYADFITLLFAFFVVMYALSMEDLSKVKAAAESIRKAFGDVPTNKGMINLNGSGGSPTVQVFDAQQATGGRQLDLPAGHTNSTATSEPSLKQVKDMLEETVSLELGVTDTSELMQMTFDSRGLVVRLAAKDFFAPGEAAVRQDLRPVLDRIGRVMAHTKRLIRVEGHTDPTEAKTPGYANDWELSSARAAWVVTYWISRFNLDARRLGVAGYGHFRPLANNPGSFGGKQNNPGSFLGGKNNPGLFSDWAQSKNRRIEVIVLNELYASPGEP